MKAIQVDGEKLIWADVASAQCGAGEVKVRVHATAINRADLLQRAGGYPPPPGASRAGTGAGHPPYGQPWRWPANCKPSSN